MKVVSADQQPCTIICTGPNLTRFVAKSAHCLGSIPLNYSPVKRTVMRSRREHDARRAVGLRGGPDAVDGVGAQHHGDDADEEVGDVPPLLLVLLRVGVG